MSKLVNGAIQVQLSSTLCLSLPISKQLGLPYVFVRFLLEDEPNLCFGICSVEEFPKLHNKFGDAVCVVSEHSTYDAIVPQPIADIFGLRPGDAIWLVGWGTYMEVWPEATWFRQHEAAFEAMHDSSPGSSSAPKD